MPELIWKGKDKVINHHQEVQIKTLVHQYTFGAEHEGESGNKIIQGDNLEALKALLPQYEGKIKCIYIDPPYNTGNEGWVYNDNVNDPRIKKWLGEVVGKEGEDLCRHDKWLCMMYPRLQILKRLLTEDGFIFISIDDIESTNLKLVLNEIFSPRAFVAQMVWKSRSSVDARALTGLSTDHEYVFCYRKSDASALRGVKKDLDKFSNNDNDPRGPWRSADLTGLATSAQRPNLHYDLLDTKTGLVFKSPPKGWRYDKTSMAKKVRESRILFPNSSEKRPRHKVFQNEMKSIFKALSSVITSLPTGGGTKTLNELLGSGVFDFPKPYQLIEMLLEQVVHDDPNAIVLDSFAGSGTTAHAVQNLNSQDGGNRKFILIEMMDYAETITAERMRRVIDGYGEGDKLVKGTGGGFDYYSLGERVFNDEGNLNESIGTSKIRQYVAWTEKLPIIESHEHPFWLGERDRTGFYFYYVPDQRTELNLDFLKTLQHKNESYLIYADTCLLDDKFMRKNKIRFKKIPRDISRF